MGLMTSSSGEDKQCLPVQNYAGRAFLHDAMSSSDDQSSVFNSSRKEEIQGKAPLLRKESRIEEVAKL